MEIIDGDAKEHEVAFTRAGLKPLLIPEEEKYVTEDTTLKKLACEVAGQDRDAEEAVEPADDDEEEHLSVDQDLRCLAQARFILKSHGNFLGQVRKDDYSCKRSLRLYKVLSMT